MGSSNLRPTRRIVICLFVLALVAAVGFCTWLLWVLRNAEKVGEEPYFTHDPSLSIEKTTPDGIKYTVNNSLASFRLDVVGGDKFTSRLFPDYASALKYCISLNLPVIPSVQMIHGKCKQFNDDLCAVLELAIQKGIPDGGVRGKRQALTSLAGQLLAEIEKAPAERKAPLEKALVYVATALDLGGTEVTLSPELKARVNTTRNAYLDMSIASTPTGFWQQNEDLRSLFVQDRWLMQGLRPSEEPGAVVALATIISRGPELAREFKLFREFDAKLTNPPRCIRQGELLSPSSACPSFSTIAAMLPGGIPIQDLLDPRSIQQFKMRFAGEFGETAGFALVSYSQSKEYDLFLQLANTGRTTDGEFSLDLIIDAVRNGTLSLEPKPDSGWYDYQWYALETLLRPEKARESPKLILSDAYKKRLRTAFKTALTKDRDTHIKHLPAITMCGSMDESKPIKSNVGPEFSVEPTATVYLRTARGYRFLRTALVATLGEKSLASLSRGPTGSGQNGNDLDTQLTKMTLLLYGIYDRTSTEIGQTPSYLPDEITRDEILQARTMARDWLAGASTDPDVTADTRVAVPISHYPGGPVRYWATGGIKLQRVKYEYMREPAVSGITPVYVPTFYYLPTDLPLEFEMVGGSPLSRAEFRRICDSSGDEATLRKLLGVKPDSNRPIVPFVLGACIVAVLAIVVLVPLLLRKYSPKVPVRKVVRIAFAILGSWVVVWILLFILSPSYRLKFIVRHFAARNIGIGLLLETRLFYPYAYRQTVPSYMLRSLADLLSDPNPQVRYLAMAYLSHIAVCRDDMTRAFAGIEGMDRALRTATDDPVSEVAQGALMLLGNFKSEGNVALLRGKLKSHRANDLICVGALVGLAKTGDPAALDDVMPFTDDPRRIVRRMAIDQLGHYRDARVTRRIAGLLRSSDEVTVRAALSSIAFHTYLYTNDITFSSVMDPVLLEMTQTATISGSRREQIARSIEDTALRVRAYENLLLNPSADKYTTVEDYQCQVAYTLREMGSNASSAIPVLQTLLEDPNTTGKVQTAVVDAIKCLRRK